MKFEYCILNYNAADRNYYAHDKIGTRRLSESLVAALDMLGMQGWELKTLEPYNSMVLAPLSNEPVMIDSTMYIFCRVA